MGPKLGGGRTAFEPEALEYSSTQDSEVSLMPCTEGIDFALGQCPAPGRPIEPKVVHDRPKPLFQRLFTEEAE